MSIDAKIVAVTIVSPDVPSGDPCVHLHLEPRERGGVAGQSVLTVLNPPAADLGVLVGTEIWGNDSVIMVGDTKWANRVGYTQIELV